MPATPRTGATPGAADAAAPELDRFRARGAAVMLAATLAFGPAIAGVALLRGAGLPLGLGLWLALAAERRGCLADRRPLIRHPMASRLILSGTGSAPGSLALPPFRSNINRERTHLRPGGAHAFISRSSGVQPSIS